MVYRYGTNSVGFTVTEFRMVPYVRVPGGTQHNFIINSKNRYVKYRVPVPHSTSPTSKSTFMTKFHTQILNLKKAYDKFTNIPL
jgi:hypothetical protein